MANNLIETFQDPAFSEEQGTGWIWEGNIVNTNSLGSISSDDPGIIELDPQLTLDVNGVFRLSAASPAIDAAVGEYGILDDIDGQPRTGLLDVGADEFSGAPIVRVPLLPGDVGPFWLNGMTPPIEPPVDPPVDPPANPISGDGGCGPDGCAIQAENFASVLDPDNDGNRYSVASDPDALAGEVLRAPSGDRVDLATEDHDTIATYVLEFETEGTYTLYYRARGFGSSSDSLFIPTGFNRDPDDSQTLSSNGFFEWRQESTSFTISASNVGVPVEFRFGMREGTAEIDAFVLHLDSNLSDNELEALFVALEPAPEPTTITGDFDADGDVDGDDVDFYVGNHNRPATDEFAQLDLNGDGEVTIADHNLHVTTLAMTSNGVTGALLGDVNLDGMVDVLSDAFALISGLGNSSTSRSQGDLDANGTVDVLGDAFLLISELGFSNDD